MKTEIINAIENGEGTLTKEGDTFVLDLGGTRIRISKNDLLITQDVVETEESISTKSWQGIVNRYKRQHDKLSSKPAQLELTVEEVENLQKESSREAARDL